MNSVCPWIYIDHTNNIWKFSQNDNKELHYSIMYGEGKWTKENLIDTNVLEFAIYIEKDETIHIVYSNTKGELRYCTMKDKQWVGKMLYHIESNEFKIQNLKVEIIREEMHIFYLLIANNDSDHGVLTHCIWNGKEVTVKPLQDIILTSNLKEYYSIHVKEKNNIDIFFATNEGNEISLNYCNFQNYKCSSIKRLYGIKGDDIQFKVLIDHQEVHILNKCREDSIYVLDHVYIDISGSMQEFRVHESCNELADPLLFIENNQLFSCWLEQGEIFYSVFHGENWDSAIYFERNNKLILSKYNCFISSNKGSSIKSIAVYATTGLDLYLFIPNESIVNMKDSLKYYVSEDNSDAPQKKDELQNLKLELSRVKSEKKSLEKKIASLGIQLQKKQRFIEEYEENISRILDQKRKADENCNVFLEVQQNIQKELEITKQKFSEEKLLTANLKKELDEIKKQLSEEKILRTNFEKELEDTKQQLLEEKAIKTSIENKLKEYEQENTIIHQQVEMISEEKEKLYEELQFEKNQSIMDRLLRKKSSGI